ncbi:arylsulfatase [Vibrio alginolyticus]|nr:arylsulfatase [Vibrio alginolyticus]
MDNNNKQQSVRRGRSQLMTAPSAACSASALGESFNTAAKVPAKMFGVVKLGVMPLPVRIKQTYLSAVLAALCLSNGVFADTVPNQTQTSDSRSPNVLVIVADDLGYSDIGAFGSEIATPNIDSLVSQGRIMTNFHTAAVSSPTRASLLTGLDHHLAGIGNMAEVVGLNITMNNPVSAPWGPSNHYDFDSIPKGYKGHLSDNAVTMPRLLADNGYHTYMVGKWHLGYDVQAPDKSHKLWFRINPEQLPSKRGFQKTFTLVDGGGSHFAPPVGQPPTPFDMSWYTENGKLFPAKDLPKDFYSTDFYTDKLIEFVEAGKDDGKPFFAYAAYTAPHWPLHAPQQDIDAQKGKYDAGYEVVRKQRIERMKKLGIVPADMPIAEEVKSIAQGGVGPKRWSELSPDERALEARKMEVYAAMVSNLDRNIGRLIEHLKSIGEYENTMIVFMSDNGAEGDPAFAPKIPGTKMDNSLGNIGRPGSGVTYGLRWAEVSAAPFRLFKGYTGAEGATSSPLVIKMNKQTEQYPNTNARIQVTDIMPTILAAAQVNLPGDKYQGRSVHPIEGVSFLDKLKSPNTFASIHEQDKALADELMGNSYVVKGDWKLSMQAGWTRKPELREDVPLRLFNLTQDRGETNDLSAKHPNITAELKEEFHNYVERVKVVQQNFSYGGR